MHVVPRWAWWAFAVPVGLFFIGLGTEVTWLRLATKPLPVLVLAAVVALARPGIRFRRLVAVGLVFGAAGDLLLELGLFVPGLLAFLVGHGWYLAAFLGVDRRLSPWTALPFAVWGVGLVLALADGAGDLLVPVAVYAGALCTLMWRAGSLLGSPLPHRAALVLFVGAVAFGLSDSHIAIDRFGPAVPGARWGIMASYWTAQALVAVGALLVDQPQQAVPPSRVSTSATPSTSSQSSPRPRKNT